MTVFIEKDQCSSELQQSGYVDVSQKKRLRKGTHHFCTILGSSRNEDSITSRGLASEGHEQSRGGKAVYSSLASPLDQNPDPKNKPHYPLEETHCS